MRLDRTAGRLVSALACGLALAGCSGPAAVKEETCEANPLPRLDQCLSADWMAQQASTLSGTCADALVTTCYDEFESVQGAEQLRQAGCDDYWKNCIGDLTCAPTDGPLLCHRVRLSLFPTHLRTDGFFQGSLIGLSCEAYWTMGKPPVASQGSPIDRLLDDAVWSRINPGWDAVQVGQGFAHQGLSTAASSVSTPAEPVRALVGLGSLPAAPGVASPRPPPASRLAATAPLATFAPTRSLNFVPISDACAADGPPVPDIQWRSSESFDAAFGPTTASAIASLSSCEGYALHKYYDWAAFTARMVRDVDPAADVPDILRARAAFASPFATPGARGNVGWLMLNQAVVSRSYLPTDPSLPANAAVQSNPAFPLTAGRDRAANLPQELLALVRQVTPGPTPVTHRQGIVFSRAQAHRVVPCAGLACQVPLVTEDWAWHGDHVSRYQELGVTPYREAMARLQRQQLLEVFARRAQVEVAATLAGRAVTPVARDVLWPAPETPAHLVLWSYGLQTGTLATTLSSVTASERAFLREQFARDWDAIKELYGAYGEAELEARLAGLDEQLESVLTLAPAEGIDLQGCLDEATGARHVLCDWLPEMFVDRFQGLRETDLLRLPITLGADFPRPGPQADQRRCAAYLRGASWPRLQDFTFSCPLNSAVAGKGKYEICGCAAAGADGHLGVAHWHCGDAATSNPPQEAPNDLSVFPTFYPARNYRADHLALEGYFTRSDAMSQVTFAVLTAFIPPCSPTPTMTEVHATSQQFGNGLFGATLSETFSWSKDGLSERSDLDASVTVSSTFLGSSQEFVALQAHATRARGEAGSGTASLRVAGVDLGWPTSSRTASDDYAALSGSYYFSVGPIPISVAWGVGGGWSASSAVQWAAPAPVKVNARAGAFTSLFVEGGVDAGLASVGVGASIDIVKVGPDFAGLLALRQTDLGAGGTDRVSLSSTLDFDTTLLAGRFYAWAKVGACPFCKKFDATLFDWSGFNQHSVVWSRQFEVQERDLDKLQGWQGSPQRPPSCQ